MKLEKIDPDGNWKINREIFSDLGKWLITAGGMWLYAFGISGIIFDTFRMIGVAEPQKLPDFTGGSIAMMVIGGGLMFINQFRLFIKKVAKKKS
jgi:hypothetical protein